MLRFRRIRVKRLSVFLLTIILISGSAYLLGWSSVLTVKTVSITGTSAEIEIFRKLAADAIELEVGSKLARIETKAIKRSIGNLNWIDEVNVSRDWLNRQVQIKVIERQAVAKAITSEKGIVNVDSSGEIFEPISSAQRAIQDNLPLVIAQGNDRSQLASAATLIAQLTANMPDLLINLRSITVANSGFIEMETEIAERVIRINWGLALEINQKIEILTALLRLPENKEIMRVDLSQPELPIVS
jgi:cell division protein FtsQ